MPAGRGRGAASTIAGPKHAPVAQLDRVSASEAEGRGFESRRARIFHLEETAAALPQAVRSVEQDDARCRDMIAAGLETARRFDRAWI